MLGAAPAPGISYLLSRIFRRNFGSGKFDIVRLCEVGKVNLGAALAPGISYLRAFMGIGASVNIDPV